MKTKITVNGYHSKYDQIDKIKEVRFDFLGEKVYAAQVYEEIFGVFVSDVIEGPSTLINWRNLSWSETKYTGTDIQLYVKTASTVSGLNSADWYGPYLNSSGCDISELANRYMRLVAVMKSNSGEKAPTIRGRWLQFHR